MANKKNQHFVPRFLLRQFAADTHVAVGDRRQINMINFARHSIMKNVSIKNQCASPYFYGNDLVIEDMLGKLEGVFNESIKRVIETNALSCIVTDKSEIATLIALQKARTAAAEEETNAAAEKMARLVASRKFDRSVLDKYKIYLENAAALNVTNALFVSPIMWDLRQILVINKTTTPFIISDNPVCMTNWFFKTRRPYLETGGTASSGIQLFMPISPWHTLLLIDHNVYSTGSSESTINITRKSEIDHLNKMQVINSFKNVYFGNALTDIDANKLMEIQKPDRVHTFERMDQVSNGQDYVITEKNECDPPTPGVRSELVRMASFALPDSLRLKQIKIRPKPKFYDNGSMAGPMRDPAWAQIVQDFAGAIHKGRCKFGDLLQFASLHPLRNDVGDWIRNKPPRI